MNKTLIKVIVSVLFLFNVHTYGQATAASTWFVPDEKGNIPVWQVTGPFDYPLVGFGVPADSIFAHEAGFNPASGENGIGLTGHNEWIVQSINKKKFLDLNASLGWKFMPEVPVKIWYAKSGYAFTRLLCDEDKEAVLKVGSNSHLRIFVNGTSVFNSNQERNAVPDADAVPVKLHKGENTILFRTLNTHKNLGLSYFGFIQYEWGFYARLLEKNGNPLSGVKFLLPEQGKSDFSMTSTFFFKKIDGVLKQRFDVSLISGNKELQKITLKMPVGSKVYDFTFDSVTYGNSRLSVYLPEITEKQKVNVEITVGTEKIVKTISLEPRKKYTMHVMMLNHTDIGYTQPQPVVEEIHVTTIDDVVAMCEKHPDFRWTLETTLQLELYEKSRTKEQFKKLIDLIKQKRVALSPIYSNPFTGWVSEEEMIRSLDKAQDYKRRYGIEFHGAVYNDVPGEAWFLPQVMVKSGVKFLAEGLNEFYGEYRLQKSLPKMFYWESPDGSKLLTFLNNAYSEGRGYGLESTSLFTIEQRLWERLNKLEADNYEADIVLLNAAFTDNSIIPTQEYDKFQEWNRVYEYPKFVSSNVELFAEEAAKQKCAFKVMRGDFISDWDVNAQGEPSRMKKMRWIQNNLLSAEKLATVSSLLDGKRSSFNKVLDDAYSSLLLFTGHGSGLEYGYGSPAENQITMDFRGHYVNDAYFATETLLEKTMHRMTKPDESFESECMYVFNPLSWKRDAVIDFEHKFPTDAEYQITDINTGKVIPTFRDGIRQCFVARELPSVGYKKFALKTVSAKPAYHTDLRISENAIENSFYRIAFNPISRKITAITDKLSGRNLLPDNTEFSFASPVVERMQIKPSFLPLTDQAAKLSVIDESPVCLKIAIKSDNAIFTNVSVALYDSTQEISVTAVLNQSQLKAPQYYEEFGLPFTFGIKNAKVKLETLGGFMDPTKDVLPGIKREGFSLRRSAVIYNDKESIVWSTADARIIKLAKDSVTGEPVIISNPLNNFPTNWNRNEANDGLLEVKYSIAYFPKTYDAEMVRQGWDLNTPALWRKSWYKLKPGTESFVQIENPKIVLLTLKDEDDSIAFRLINSDNESTQKTNVSSKLVKALQCSIKDLSGNPIRVVQCDGQNFQVSLKPGEVIDAYLSKK